MPVSPNEIEAESVPLLPLVPSADPETTCGIIDGHPQGIQPEESSQARRYENSSQVYSVPQNGPDSVQMVPPESTVTEISPLNDLLVSEVENIVYNLDEIKSLLERNASANAVDFSSHLTCAQIAAKLGRADILELLIKHNADANVKDNEHGKSLIHFAVDGKHRDCLEVLLNTNKVDIDCVDHNMETAMFAAVKADWLDGVTLLLNHADRPDLERTYGKSKKTVLQYALEMQNLSVFRLVVNRARAYDNFKQIIDVVKDDDKMTPLFIAVVKGSLESVQILLQAQADVTLHDKWDRNILHCAAEKGYSHIIEELFRHNGTKMKELCKERCKGRLQGSPLHIAVNRNDSNSVQYLIEKGKVSISDVADLGDYKDCNILHIASATDKTNIIKYFTGLLNRSGSDISSLVCETTSCGETALHFALKRRQTDFVFALIAAGSDLTAKCFDKNNCPRTALDILIYQVPSSVQMLNNILDKSIKKNKKNTSVSVDYKVLMTKVDKDNIHKMHANKISPKSDSAQKTASAQNSAGTHTGNGPTNSINKQVGDSLGVLNALRKTGDRLGQRKLLEHPLVESFVYLHWKRLEGPYAILVTLNIIFAILLSLQVLLRIILNSPGPIWTLVVFVIIFMVPLLVHEAECLAKSKPWPYHAESLMRCVCFTLTIWVCFPQPAPVGSAFAVLLAWFEVILLISRIPLHGYYMLMFIEIAYKYVKLLLSFVFVIFGFVVAFMAIFEQSPFISFWPAVLKTILMMTNEFEFDNLYTNFQAKSTLSPFSKMLAMGVFVLFIIFIGLVLTNLFVAVAVNDIKKLHLISKQTEFLGVYEIFLLSEPWWSANRGIMLFLHRGFCAAVRLVKPKWVQTWDSFAEVKSSYVIDILINEDVLRFPEELNSAIIVKGYECMENSIKEYKENNDMVKDSEAAEKLKLKEKQSLKQDLREMMIAVFDEKIAMLRQEVNQVKLKNGN